MNDSMLWAIYVVGLSMDEVEARIISLMLEICLSKNLSKREHIC